MMALSEKAARVDTRVYLLIILVIAAFLRLLYLNY
jgi:hypothetical protein